MKREIEKRNMLIMYPHLIVSFNFIYSLAFNAIGKEKQNKNPEILKGKKKEREKKNPSPHLPPQYPTRKGREKRRSREKLVPSRDRNPRNRYEKNFDRYNIDQ